MSLLTKFLKIRVSEPEKKRIEKEAKDQTKIKKRNITVSDIGRSAMDEYFARREKEK